MLNNKTYATLTLIAHEAMPGDDIRHTSWPENKKFTCSTEFLMGFGGYPYAGRAVQNSRGFPAVVKNNGHWVFAGTNPVNPNPTPRRSMAGEPAPITALSKMRVN